MTVEGLTVCLALLASPTLGAVLGWLIARRIFRAHLAVYEIALLGHDDEAREAAQLRIDVRRLTHQARNGSGIRL